jgi:hypothetical protein
MKLQLASMGVSMRRQTSRINERIILCFIMLFSYSVVPRSADRMLLKIENSAGIEAVVSVLRDIRVVQELDTGWIVETSSEIYSTLQRLGVACEILDPQPGAKTYYLLLGGSYDQIQAIEPLGNLKVLEDQVWLFGCEGDAFLELLPPEVHIKCLPETTAATLVPPSEGRGIEEHLQAEIGPNPKVVQMAGTVSQAGMTMTIQRLQDFRTRRATTADLEAAGEYIFEYFQRCGIAVEYDPFTFLYQGASYPTRNIVATIPGKTIPEQIVIVGAHYDSTSNDAFNLAPGADDNASGSAAVMEMARIMGQYEFDRTVRFICFSAEELGLFGSRHYAQQAAQKRETIQGMIDLDMIGYTAKVPEDLDLITNSSSDWLANLFVSCTGTYTTLPIVKSIRPSVTGSDHSSFWDQGYSAVMGIEANPLTNPFYHRTTDTLATLNMDFAAAVTRAALATAATLALPVGMPATPTNVTAHSIVTRSLFLRFKTTLLSWNSTDPTVVGFNVYRSADLGASYQKINAALLKTSEYADRFLEPGRTYWYVVTAVDGQGRESYDSAGVQNE